MDRAGKACSVIVIIIKDTWLDRNGARDGVDRTVVRGRYTRVQCRNRPFAVLAQIRRLMQILGNHLLQNGRHAASAQYFLCFFDGAFAVELEHAKRIRQSDDKFECGDINSVRISDRFHRYGAGVSIHDCVRGSSFWSVD